MRSTNLVTLSGQPGRAIPSALSNANPRELSNIDAGFVFWKLVADLYPGITWRQAFELGKEKKLSGWWTDLKNGVGDIYDGTKTVIGDIFEGTGDVGGSTVRLLADEEVSGTIARGAAAYYTGGTSEGIMGILSGFMNKSGETYKQTTGLPPWTLWTAGGVAFLAVLWAALR